MKEFHGFVLHISSDIWQIVFHHNGSEIVHAVSGSAGVTPVIAVQLTIEAINSLGFTSRDAIIVISPNDCLCAAISTQNLPMRKGRVDASKISKERKPKPQAHTA